MTPASLLARFRTEVADTARPYLWSDAEIISYMDEAQSRFIRVIGGIPDATSAITTVVCIADEPFVDVSPLILKLRAVTRDEDGKTVTIWNYEDTDVNTIPFSLTETGTITHVVTGMSENSLRLIPTPDVEQTLNLVVERLPNELDQTTEAFEIDRQHHWALMEGVKALAYLKHDADTFDKTKAAEHEANFKRAANDAMLARGRREHKYRSMKFSW